MSNYESLWALMSSHKHQEQPSLAMKTYEDGAMVLKPMISTHKHAWELLRMALAVPKSIHLYLGCMPPYLWVLISVHECFWLLKWSIQQYTNNSDFLNDLPVVFCKYIDQDLTKNWYVRNLHIKGCWKMTQQKFLNP